ncbi:hypothetical protein HKX48_006526 [Thoreauomyces humboldtii]|nr:hypothetical protein HKX48_006526 [Thoreauomyces humboldtii]
MSTSYASLLSGVTPPKVRPGAVSPFDGVAPSQLSSPSPSSSPFGRPMHSPTATNRVSPFPAPLGSSSSPTGSSARVPAGLFGTPVPRDPMPSSSSLFGNPVPRDPIAAGRQGGGGAGWASQPMLYEGTGSHGAGGMRGGSQSLLSAQASPRGSGAVNSRSPRASGDELGGSSTPPGGHSTNDLGQRRSMNGGPSFLLEIATGGKRVLGDEPRKRTTSSLLFGAPLDRYEAPGEGGMQPDLGRRRSFTETGMSTTGHNGAALDDITPLPTEEDDDDAPLVPETPVSPSAADDGTSAAPSTPTVKRKVTYTEERRDRVPPLLPLPEKFTNTSSWKEKGPTTINIRDFDKIAHKLADVENAGWFEGYMNLQMLDELDVQESEANERARARVPLPPIHIRHGRDDSDDEDQQQLILAANASAQFRASLEAEDGSPVPYVRLLVGAKPDPLRNKEDRAAALAAVNAAIAARNMSLNDGIVKTAAIDPSEQQQQTTQPTQLSQMSTSNPASRRGSTDTRSGKPPQAQPPAKKKGLFSCC